MLKNISRTRKGCVTGILSVFLLLGSTTEKHNKESQDLVKLGRWLYRYECI